MRTKKSTSSTPIGHLAVQARANGEGRAATVTAREASTVDRASPRLTSPSGNADALCYLRPSSAAPARFRRHPLGRSLSRMGILLPIYILVFIGLIYLVGVRPQQKRRKELQDIMSRLQPGDEVVTVSGIYGTITEVEDGETVLLEVAED